MRARHRYYEITRNVAEMAKQLEDAKEKLNNFKKRVDETVHEVEVLENMYRDAKKEMDMALPLVKS